MKMLLLLKGIKTEKEAQCILQEDSNLQSEKQVQANFNCEITLENNEYKDLNLSDPYSVTVSPDNEAVSGCSELNKEESSPKATDNAIEQSKNENSELAKAIDYSLEENKNNVVPTLEIIDIIDINKCNTTGIFKLKGSFNFDIEEEMTFELPLSYPKANIKCEIEKTEKNKETEIYCKVQKGFKNIKSLIIEPRLIKKKRKELLFIANKTITFTQEYTCNNFNTIKLQRAKAQKSSPYVFLQMSRPAKMDPSLIFIMALLKKVSQASFTAISINIDVVILKSSLLRYLQETSNLQNLQVNCNVQESSGTSCSMGCTSIQTINGNVTNVEINDDNIGGIPEKINVETNPAIDYSLKENLVNLDELPSITITDFSADECDTNGKFVINGDIEGNLENADNITIKLFNPDSSGLCALNVENNNATINCENGEDFDVSTIMISPQIVNNKYGNSSLFKIANDYTSTNQYSCVISYQWSLPNTQSISNSSLPSSSSSSSSPSSSSSSPSSDTDSESGKRYYIRKESSSGLSKGGIAAIVICSVVALGTIITLTVLGKKGMFSKKKNVEEGNSSVISSSIKNL